MATALQTRYDVGGVLLDRPFKIRRLGHFGFNVEDMDTAERFYIDLLGFRISDVHDGPVRRASAEVREQLKGLGAPGYFTRYGSDHHAFVLGNLKVRRVLDPARAGRPEITVNQITWQVGSLAEVVNAWNWFTERGVPVSRTGRDMPGSNWHSYLPDPDGHTNELYYGIEQVGWEGWSKPKAMYDRAFHEPVPLPQISEFQEIEEALARGQDLHEGYRFIERLPAKYEVDGILLPRPFKITKIGPVSLFTPNLDRSRVFYENELGFILTEEVEWNGYRCLFLRSNTEHHSVALYPLELREVLGFSPHTRCMAFGLQLANYRQLRDAVAFLRSEGVTVRDDVPSELTPGMEYTAHAFDADGHCVQLYCYMEQIGWDGWPRPGHLRRPIEPGRWPDALEPTSDTYHGEPFFGPWG